MVIAQYYREGVGEGCGPGGWGGGVARVSGEKRVKPGLLVKLIYH